MTTEPLLKSLRYVMSDEPQSRSACCRLQEFYADSATREMKDRQEFTFEAPCACVTVPQQEVWEGWRAGKERCLVMADEGRRSSRTSCFQDRALQEARLPIRNKAPEKRFTELGVIQFEDGSTRRGDAMLDESPDPRQRRGRVLIVRTPRVIGRCSGGESGLRLVYTSLPKQVSRVRPRSPVLEAEQVLHAAQQRVVLYGVALVVAPWCASDHEARRSARVR